jgi:hypothetical protein
MIEYYTLNYIWLDWAGALVKSEVKGFAGHCSLASTFLVSTPKKESDEARQWVLSIIHLSCHFSYLLRLVAF